jgi:hypothetical protein
MIKKSERLTKAICNKGFSGNSSSLPRSNFGVDGQEIARNRQLFISLSVGGNVTRKDNN